MNSQEASNLYEGVVNSTKLVLNNTIAPVLSLSDKQLNELFLPQKFNLTVSSIKYLYEAFISSQSAYFDILEVIKNTMLIQSDKLLDSDKAFFKNFIDSSQERYSIFANDKTLNFAFLLYEDNLQAIKTLKSMNKVSFYRDFFTKVRSALLIHQEVFELVTSIMQTKASK